MTDNIDIELIMVFIFPSGFCDGVIFLASRWVVVEVFLYLLLFRFFLPILGWGGERNILFKGMETSP